MGHDESLETGCAKKKFLLSNTIASRDAAVCQCIAENRMSSMNRVSKHSLAHTAGRFTFITSIMLAFEQRQNQCSAAEQQHKTVLLVNIIELGVSSHKQQASTMRINNISWLRSCQGSTLHVLKTAQRHALK